MPRHIDPELEGRIIEAARKLWQKGGEKALNMRSVARMARTNTPAVYRRFRHREDILKALVESYQMDLFRMVEGCESLQEVAQGYLEFVLSRPREYQLVMSGLLPRVTKARPTLDLIVHRASEWLGGQPGEYRGLVMALAALVDGTAMFKITGFLPEDAFVLLRNTTTQAVDLMVSNAKSFRSKKSSLPPQLPH